MKSPAGAKTRSLSGLLRVTAPSNRLRAAVNPRRRFPMKGTILDFLKLANEKPELAQELVDLAAKHDFEFSDEVSDKDLESVAGGVGGTDPIPMVYSNLANLRGTVTDGSPFNNSDTSNSDISKSSGDQDPGPGDGASSTTMPEVFYSKDSSSL